MDNGCHFQRAVVVIPTSSLYIDICMNFIDLLEKNWNDCPYEIVLAITGDNVEVTNCKQIKKIYCGQSVTLPQCIFNVAKKVRVEYYICFLGDAFLSERVQNSDIENIIITMKMYQIEYCRLIPKKRRNVEKINSYLRRPCDKERYTVSFIAFISSFNFIEKEFGRTVTDLDFERKYEKVTNCQDFAVVNHNYLHIVAGIDKGRWNRRALHRLKKRNPSVEFSKRGKLSVKDQLIYDLREIFEPIMSEQIRKKVKRLLSKLGIFDFTINE